MKKIVLSACLLSSIVYAQSPLTNADVIRMVAYGISPSLVKTTINKSKAGFDLSTADLDADLAVAPLADAEAAPKVVGAPLLRGGDVADEKAVAPAMEGVTRVVYCVGPATSEVFKSMERPYVWGLRNVLNYGGYRAQSEGPKQLKQIVLLSAVYITRPWHLGSAVINTLFGFSHRWHVVQEQMIRDSGINYIIVRPPRLGSSEGDPEQVEVAQGDNCKGSFLSRSGLAELMVKSMFEPLVPTKVTFEASGIRGTKADTSYAWDTVWRQLQADFDPLPKVEKTHVLAQRVYVTVFLGTLLAAGGFLISRFLA